MGKTFRYDKEDPYKRKKFKQNPIKNKKFKQEFNTEKNKKERDYDFFQKYKKDDQ